MDVLKVTELRQNLAQYLAKAKRGHRVKVTSRGKVIAELAPPPASREKAAAARARLRGSVLMFNRPTEPAIDPGEWDANR
jgi:antitoxin (DNA-binding transcriptional repressor) of toxin-antitoxin stability system